MKRVPLRPVSKKRAREQAIRRRLAEQMWREGPVLCVICGVMADDLHEPRLRSRGGDPTDFTQVMPVCRDCHSYVHLNPAGATRLGFMKHSWDRDDGVAQGG